MSESLYGSGESLTPIQAKFKSFVEDRLSDVSPEVDGSRFKVYTIDQSLAPQLININLVVLSNHQETDKYSDGDKFVAEYTGIKLVYSTANDPYGNAISYHRLVQIYEDKGELPAPHIDAGLTSEDVIIDDIETDAGVELFLDKLEYMEQNGSMTPFL